MPRPTRDDPRITRAGRPRPVVAGRRLFLQRSGLAAVAATYPHLAATAASGGGRFDVAVIGGGLGGCAAALAAARVGKRVFLSEPTDWLGGQLTQQGVPPDEHRWIEERGATASYREFRERVRGYYRRNYPLTDPARANPLLNPGNGSVSRLCHEPRVALAVLDEMLAPAASRGLLEIALEARPVEASADGDRVEAVKLSTPDGGRWVEADYFIDATEQGDLLPLTGTEFVTGSESRDETGEEHASEEADPDNIQAFTWCFAMDHLAGEDHTVDEPSQYRFWRDYVPDLEPPWPGKLLSLTYSNPRTLEPRMLSFVPPPAGAAPPETQDINLWLYRRIIDPAVFLPGSYASGITVVNWPQNDYMPGNLITGDAGETERHLEGGRQLSLSLLYWLQTEAPRPDGGTGWPGLRLRHDVMGTADGLAKFPYIRESRRIRAEFTVLEQHISRAAREAIAPEGGGQLLAERFVDSVGVGSYHLDLHPSSGGDNTIDFASVPFQVPLGALIPRRVRNLIAGGKNIGTTHVSNGCYRLHPVEWSIGEAAGALAAHCLGTGESPTAVRNSNRNLERFQASLVGQGFELEWQL